MTTYELRITETGPNYSSGYRWSLRYNDAQVADGFADTRWGCRRAAKRAARKHKRQRVVKYDVKETLGV